MLAWPQELAVPTHRIARLAKGEFRDVAHRRFTTRGGPCGFRPVYRRINGRPPPSILGRPYNRRRRAIAASTPVAYTWK